jgi:hypothetical protein
MNFAMDTVENRKALSATERLNVDMPSLRAQAATDN